MQTTLQSRIGWTRAEPQPHAPEQPCLRNLLHSSEVVVLKVWSGGPLGSQRLFKRPQGQNYVHNIIRCYLPVHSHFLTRVQGSFSESV